MAEKLQSLHEHLISYSPPSEERLEELKRGEIRRADRIEEKKRKWADERRKRKEGKAKEGVEEEGEEEEEVAPDFEADEPTAETFRAPPGFYMFGPVG